MGKLMKLSLLFALTGMLLLFACESKIFPGDGDCEECFTDKPDFIDLTFYWSDEFDTIVVNINKGTIEEGEYIGSWELFNNPATVRLEMSDTYSCEARYERDGKTYWVVDGTKPKLKKIIDYCAQGDCWVVENSELYIELKY